MKKYIYTILSLCLIINQLIASEVLITPPNRFYKTGELVPVTLRTDLPSTRVIDGVLGPLHNTALTAASHTLKYSGRPLSAKTRQVVERSQGTFGTVRLVQELWQNTLDSFPQLCPVTGCTPMCIATDNWRKQPILTVKPHAECMDGCQLNAYYDPRTHKLIFPEFVDKGQMKYTCSSFDVVAHEAGHACLNAMAPNLLRTGRLDHKALHESFGDLTALFASLSLVSEDDQAAWLTNPSSATCIGGDLTGACIRDPHDREAIGCEEHSLSKPLTRFMCNYLRYQWNQARGTSPNDILHQVRKDFLKAILLNLRSDNILTAITHYFHRHKTPIEDSYLKLLTYQFTTCAVAA
ncbi:MAG: hypothetical protein Q8Q56_04900 [Alphaproteobacteria bacterium]|nr:hypothetical protein [Alphaproteobacteria bacterium]